MTCMLQRLYDRPIESGPVMSRHLFEFDNEVAVY
jgi:hypothetical protein